MAETKAEQELVEVKLDRPYTTNDTIHGYVSEATGKPVELKVGVKPSETVRFTGQALVNADLAEDLNRRQAEYRSYEASLNANKGKEAPVFL